ncbi:metal/formaldehyde-sensitive transcriptional repressor [Alkanindiges illinoisensis]|uniref:metal/formaldehyde-sensitive transcriptional repressor n=1 Tax=Alkanindiges illinoisensis TaxID=197183 RepID=UPI00047D888A|nr:metal/formaldehyde-sensitive transcriptional repressor [Alkanindiges illinoisensis]
MSHIHGDKNKLISRIRRIKGQVNALEDALGQDIECLKVLQQIAAIQGAVNGLMNEVLENHLREHIGNEQNQRELEEVLTIIKRYMK